MLKAHFEKLCSSSFPSLLWVPQRGSCTPESVGDGASCLPSKLPWSVSPTWQPELRPYADTAMDLNSSGLLVMD